MSITPYTPVKELKKLIRMTYGSQALSAVVSATAIFAMYLVYHMAMVAMGGTGLFTPRLIMAALFGVLILFFLRAIRNCAVLFIGAAEARAELRWLIARKLGDA